MVRTEGRLHFASAPNTTDKFFDLVGQAEPRIVVIDFSAVPDVEYTALKMLEELDEKLSAAGVTLWLAALNPEPLNIIRRSALEKKFGRERMYFSLEQVVEAYRTQYREYSEEKN